MKIHATLSSVLSFALLIPASASAVVKTGALVPAVPRVTAAPALSAAPLLVTPALTALTPAPLLAPTPALAAAPSIAAPSVVPPLSAAFAAAADAPKLAATQGLAESVMGAQEALKAGDAGQARAVGASVFDAGAKFSAASDSPVLPGSTPLGPPSQAEMLAAWDAAKPKSKVRSLVPPEMFPSMAVDLLMQYTFASKGFLQDLAAQIPFFDRRGQAFLAAAKELVAVHDGTDAASRRFTELAGRWYAFAEAQEDKMASFMFRGPFAQPPHMPPSPLPEGEYWDMAAGINGGRYVRRPEVGKTTPYVLFDLSPFAASYIRTSAELAGKPNVTVREEDLLKIKKPAKPLAVLRTKNAIAYVPGFEKKLEEMVDWIAEGGQLVIQSDAGPGRHEFIWEKHEPLVRRLLKQGWTFEFGFAGTRGPLGHYGYDSLIFTRPSGTVSHLNAAEVEKAWQSYRDAVRYRYRRSSPF